jgi:hypothetical protein
MTVLEPTPDRAPRGPLLRRVCFVASALALTGAFALSLSGIATTRGAVRPGGQAAAIAAQQRIASRSGGDGATGRHHCRRGDRNRSGSGAGAGAPGRV